MPIKKKKPAKKPVKKIIRKKSVVTKKRVIARRTKKTKVSSKKQPKKPKNKVIAKITHFFPHVNAAVLKLKLPLMAGETIWIKGHTTDFKQTVASMQIDRVAITEAKKGDEIGLQVAARVRRNDVVYKV